MAATVTSPFVSGTVMGAEKPGWQTVLESSGQQEGLLW